MNWPKIPYHNFLDAIMAIQPADAEFIAVWHKLSADEGYRWHHHPKANEWVLIRGGVLQVFTEKNIREYDLRGNRDIRVFHFPPGSKHTLRAVTDLKYLVVRDCDDISVYDE